MFSVTCQFANGFLSLLSLCFVNVVFWPVLMSGYLLPRFKMISFCAATLDLELHVGETLPVGGRQLHVRHARGHVLWALLFFSSSAGFFPLLLLFSFLPFSHLLWSLKNLQCGLFVLVWCRCLHFLSRLQYLHDGSLGYEGLSGPVCACEVNCVILVCVHTKGVLQSRLSVYSLQQKLGFQRPETQPSIIFHHQMIVSRSCFSSVKTHTHTPVLLRRPPNPAHDLREINEV